MKQPRQPIGIRICSVSLAALMAIPASQALAAPEAAAEFAALEEITVTAQRREQSLQDVPISISALGVDDLERNMISDVTDYFAIVPNVNVSEGGTPEERRITIRGVSNFRDRQGGRARTVGVYVDEFSVGTATNNPSLYDVERIEVLRGPQGTFFGRNASAGAINIIRKKPDGELYAEGEVGYARDNTWTLGGIVNAPVSEKIFLRGSVHWDRTDGFIKNVNPTGNDAWSEALNMRIASRVLLTDALTLDLSYDRLEYSNGAPALIDSGVLGSFGRSIFGDVDGVLDGLPPYPENRTRINRDAPERRDNNIDTLVGRLEYKGEDFTVTSITGYIDRKLTFFTDVDATSQDIIVWDLTLPASSFSQELRINSNFDTSVGNFSWFLGGMYAKDWDDSLSKVSFGADNPVGPPAAGLAIFHQLRDRELTNWGVFGQMDWQVTGALTFSAGARYSEDELYDVLTNFRISDEPVEDGKNTFSDFAPNVSVRYDATDELSVYGTVSKGYKVGGLQTNPALPKNFFDPEIVWNYEAGLKAQLFENRLRVNAAFFYMDWKDLQVDTRFSVIEPDGGVAFVFGTDNVAASSTKGVELELAAQASENLVLSGAVGYLDAQIDSYPNATLNNEGVKDLSGFRTPGSPKWTLNANAHYTAKVMGQEGFLRAEWRYKSGQIPNPGDLVEVPEFPFRAPAHDVWNFRAGVEGENYRVAVFINNAFDEKFFTQTIDPASLAGVQLHPSRRTFGITLTLRTN